MERNESHEFDSELESRPSGGRGVRRVNNMPLLLVCAVLAIFAMLVGMVAYNRSQAMIEHDTPVVDIQDESGASKVLEGADGRLGGVIGEDRLVLAPVPPPPPASVPSLPVAHVEDPELPPSPPTDDVELQLKAAKFKLLQMAISSKTAVAGALAKTSPGQGPASGAGAANRAVQANRVTQAGYAAEGSSGESFAQELAELQQTLNPKAGRSGRTSELSYDRFDRPADDGDRWALDSPLERPRTPFELRAGFVIPAVMISGVNSDLPGQIVGQVSEDVYDTPTGRYKLIPQGTRLVGTYQSNTQYGQRRVLVAWQRLIFPDGKAMDIGAMPGTDGIGQSGFQDRVDNHYARIFGSALLLSGVVAGINSSQTNPGNDPFGTSSNTLLTQAIAQQMGQVAVELLRKNINIAPTLVIRPGYRFNVMVVKDLTFKKPYQPFDY
jgi:type IV secretion system protein VirB10